MNGKQLGVTLAAGLVCGVILYLWEVTAAPMVMSAVGGLTGGAKA